MKNGILTINGGSSSIKYALCEIHGSLNQLFSGELENIGGKNASLRFIHTHNQQTKPIDIGIHGEDMPEIRDWKWNNAGTNQ